MQFVEAQGGGGASADHAFEAIKFAPFEAEIHFRNELLTNRVQIF